MTDDDRWGVELGGDLGNVGDVVTDTEGAEVTRRGAGSVATEAEGGGAVAVVGEVLQEVLVPAPGAMPRAVDEEDGCGVRGGGGFAREDFELHGGASWDAVTRDGAAT